MGEGLSQHGTRQAPGAAPVPIVDSSLSVIDQLVKCGVLASSDVIKAREAVGSVGTPVTSIGTPTQLSNVNNMSVSTCNPNVTTVPILTTHPSDNVHVQPTVSNMNIHPSHNVPVTVVDPSVSTVPNLLIHPSSNIPVTSTVPILANNPNLTIHPGSSVHSSVSNVYSNVNVHNLDGVPVTPELEEIVFESLRRKSIAEAAGGTEPGSIPSGAKAGGLYIGEASVVHNVSLPEGAVCTAGVPTPLSLSLDSASVAVTTYETASSYVVTGTLGRPPVVTGGVVGEQDDVSLSGRDEQPASPSASSSRSVSSVPGTSAGSKQSHTVTFADDLEDIIEPLVDAVASAAEPEFDSLTKADWRRLIYLIFRHYPESKSGRYAKKRSSFKFESLFDDEDDEEAAKKKDEPQPLLLLAYNERLVELREEIEAKAKCLPWKKKFFPPRKAWNRVPGDHALEGPPKLNSDFADLLGYQLSEDILVSIALKELLRMEAALQAQQESLSFSAWLISTLFSLLKEEGYRPRDPPFFRKIMRSFSIHAVEQSRFSLWLSHACVAARKERYLAGLPDYVSERHRKKLFCDSSPFAEFVFDPEVLSQVKTAIAESSTVGFQLSVSELVTMSVTQQLSTTRGRSRARGKSSSASTSGASASTTSALALPASSSTASVAATSAKLQQAKQALASSSTPSRGRGAAKRPRSRSRSRSRSPASARRGKGRGAKGFR